MEVRSTPSPRADPPYVRRRIVVGLGVVLVVGGVTTAVQSLLGEEPKLTSSERTPAESSIPEPATYTAGPSLAAEPTTPASPPGSGSLRVSYRETPPAIETVVVASIRPADGAFEFGVLRDGFVVLDVTASTATVYDRSGIVVRSFVLDVVPSPFVVGPDDVLYGMTPPAAGRRSMVAIPLTGLGAGGVAAQTPVLDSDTYLDAPEGILGVGTEGIVDRWRDAGAPLMPYLSLDGSPVIFGDATFVTLDADETVRDSSGPTWELEVERAPGAATPGTDPLMLMPAPKGAVYTTTLGAPTDESPGGTDAVIARLGLDGTGAWWSLPTGWRLATGSSFGTLIRKDAAVESILTIDIAWLP